MCGGVGNCLRAKNALYFLMIMLTAVRRMHVIRRRARFQFAALCSPSVVEMNVKSVTFVRSSEIVGHRVTAML